MMNDTPRIPNATTLTVELVEDHALAVPDTHRPETRQPETRQPETRRPETRQHGRLIVSGPVLIADAWRLRDIDIDGLCSPLIIDLSGVTALDVAGVAAVTDLARRMLAHGRGVQIIAPTDESVNRTAKMTGVFDLLNRQSAVAFAAA